MSTVSESKVHFGALDTLRVCAFLIVFVSHSYFSFFTQSDEGMRKFAHGEIGVHIFFVLSAFLITYLSLREYAKTGQFSVLHFFKKRILRIWPVYFIVLIASYAWHLFSGPEQSIGCMTQFLYFFGNFCAMENVLNSIGVTTLIPMWSVSVEQQFYTVFPLLLILIIWLTKKINKTYMQFIVYTGLIGIFLYSLHMRFIYAQNWKYLSYATATALPGFIFGIFLAYGMHTNMMIIQHIRTYRKTYGLTALCAFMAAFSIKFNGAIGAALYILPIIYATMIYIVLATGDSVKHKRTNIEYLGQISYGLYAYHMFAIVFLQYVNLPVAPLFKSVLSFGLTVILAHVSYKYIESWFLKFK